MEYLSQFCMFVPRKDLATLVLTEASVPTYVGLMPRVRRPCLPCAMHRVPLRLHTCENCMYSLNSLNHLTLPCRRTTHSSNLLGGRPRKILLDHAARSNTYAFNNRETSNIKDIYNSSIANYFAI
jgi:hypothetical protein